MKRPIDGVSDHEARELDDLCDWWQLGDVKTFIWDYGAETDAASIIISETFAPSHPNPQVCPRSNLSLVWFREGTDSWLARGMFRGETRSFKGPTLSDIIAQLKGSPGRPSGYVGGFIEEYPLQDSMKEHDSVPENMRRYRAGEY